MAGKSDRENRKSRENTKHGIKKKKSIGRRIAKNLLCLVLIVVLAFGGMLGFLSATEYKPDDVEPLEVQGASQSTLNAEDSFRIVTWNVGYGALGDNADFFMDGGSMVNTADQARVEENIAAIREEIESLDPDIAFLQEVDVDSARSHHINEVEYMQELDGYESTFARNFKTAFIPYPIPPIGKVESGILTMSRFPIESSERQSLPCPFSWPISMANLKRCLNVSVVPIEGSDAKLYLINLHLEAYDDGEGKIAQTNQLKNLLETIVENGDYVIAGGDFNQVFSSVDTTDYPTLEGMWQPGMISTEEFNDALCFEMDSSSPTCRSLDRVLKDADSDPENFQYYMIDGFIVSDNIQVDSLETLDLGFVNTDHNPVVMDVTLR